MTRRTLFKRLIQLGSITIGAVIGIPSLISGIAPAFQRRRRDAWRSLAALESFPVGSVRQANIDPSIGEWPPALRPLAVYVWRRLPDDVVVFSRLCTDLGCPVTFDPGSACYFCPCHGGIFNTDGERLAGPPKRPLDRYTARIREGMLEIDVNSVPATA